MRLEPAPPVCPLCGGTSWRRERFHPLEAARPTSRVVVRARCRGCGLRRFFRPPGEPAPSWPGPEGAADPVAWLRDEARRGARAGCAVANGGRWFARPAPEGRTWLFGRASLRRALAAAGWTAARIRGGPWSRTLRAGP